MEWLVWLLLLKYIAIMWVLTCRATIDITYKYCHHGESATLKVTKWFVCPFAVASNCNTYNIPPMCFWRGKLVLMLVEDF
jgi:hypothetical protein